MDDDDDGDDGQRCHGLGQIGAHQRLPARHERGLGLALRDVERRGLGLLRTDIAADAMVQALANIGAGVIARHLGNNPGVAYEDGTAQGEFRLLFHALLATFLP